MIKGLRGATIWSEDLNNPLPFYRDVMGLQTPAFAVLGAPGAPRWPWARIVRCTAAMRIRRALWSASRPTTSPRTGSA